MRYAGIELNDVANGEGVCVSVWVQGCPHHCPGCFNPGTWDFDGGKEFTTEDLNKILKSLTANGVTRNFNILGGEPMCEENLLLTSLLCQEIKKVNPEIKISIWTGYTLEQLLERKSNGKVLLILRTADILIDGPYIESLRDVTLKQRGSSNQRIINLKNLTF